MGDYRDLIGLQRPVSFRHRPMDTYRRAAQFNAFEALEGHMEAIDSIIEKREMREVDVNDIFF